MMIKLSAKGLAKFMTSSAAGQRKVLRDYKYPDEEGTPQAAYYREARDIVAQYHRDGHDKLWLRERAAVITSTATVLGGRVATRLRHNARALADDADHFAPRQLEVLPQRKFYLSFDDVRITVVPDLHVRENDRERFLKLDFGAKRPSAEIIKIVSQLMFEAAVQAQIPVRSADIIYVDVARGDRHEGARMGSRVRTEINASCANISAMWPAI
jgi:hypothetical protein